MGKSIRSTDDGLPILTKDSPDQDTTGDGLPILKKKDGAGSPAPLDSSPKPVQTARPVDTSGSGPKQVTANFKNNSVTPNEVSGSGNNGIGPTPDQISSAINNKGKNIDKDKNAPSNLSTQFLLKEKQSVQRQKNELESQTLSAQEYPEDQIKAHRDKINSLSDREAYLTNEIGKNYNYEKNSLVPELVNHVKSSVKDEDFNPETHLLNSKAVERIAGTVDGIMNKRKNSVVDAAVSGDLDNKPRTYGDLTKSVVDQLNVIPIQKAQHEFTQEYAKKNPQIEAALKANEDIHNYFSHSNFDEVKAKIKIQADKDFIGTQDKYYGTGGIFQKNQEFVGIQHKYAQLVADKKMSEEVAKKQIDAEITQNPSLKKIKGNYDSEIRKVIEGTQKKYEQYVIGGLQKEHPEYTLYKDGSIGLSSLTEDKYKKMVKDYQDGMNAVAAKMGAETNEAWKKYANKAAERVGPFWGSLGASTNSLVSGLTKMIFNKTGWGGEKVRHFQAQEIASPQISQSDVAATWNWKGLESLVHPNFYLSGLGASVPVIAGAAAVTATTEGAGLPEYVGWLASAGLFTAQSSLSTYDQLLSTKDANGNILSESDAAHFAAQQAKEDFLPNVLMMALGSGTLLKAKNIAKPTIAKAIGKGFAGAAEAQPFLSWQGYNNYSTMLEAQGKTPDMYDYLQSKEFRDNLVNGLIIGGGIGALHTPLNYMKSMDNWTKLVHTSEGEFKNLIPQNYALGQEMAGNGNYLRDALKMHVFNVDPEGLNEESTRNLTDLKNTLLYSVNLDKNIRTGNLDKNNINDLYQAHNLALADQHDYLSDQAAKEGNKSLSDIYKDKAKDYREQAKAAANDQAKYKYLVNDEGHPIFMSDKAFKVLEKEGRIAEWQKDGTIKAVHDNADPEFAQRYKDFVQAKSEATVDGKDIMDHAKGLIEENKEKLGTYYAVAKENPDLFYKEISDQIHGQNADGSISLRPDAEVSARQQFGDDIVDLAKILYPIKEGGQNAKEVRGDQEQLPQTGKAGAGVQTDSGGNIQQGAETGTEAGNQENKIAPEDNITVSEMLDKKGTYKGQRGTFVQDGQTVIFKPDNSNREYELGNVDKVGDRLLKDFGIDTEQSVVKVGDKGEISVRDKPYVNPNENPLKAIVRDGEGNVVSVKLETPEGKSRTFRGQVAEDLAYDITLKQISENNEQPALEQFINSDEAAREEINNARLAAATEGSATGDNAPIQREKIEPISSSKKEQNEKLLSTEEGANKPEAAGSGTEDTSGRLQEGKPIGSETGKKKIDSSPKTEDHGKAEKTEAEGRKGNVLTPEGEGAPQKGKTPPPLTPPPPPRAPEESPKEEFTAVRKEKQAEIKGARTLFERQKVTKWTETYDNALSNVQGMYPDKSLYEAMKSRVNEFVAKLDGGVLFNPTSEDIAVFNVYKNETMRRMNEIPGWDSEDNIQRLAAAAEFTVLNNDLYNVVRVNNPGGEAGRAFNILQSEIAQDPEYGLKIRRMELLGAKGGGRLTEADLEFTADNWGKERAILSREQELKQKGMQEQFDREMAKVKADYENKLKNARAEKKPTSQKEKREQLLKEKGAELAARIRKGKDVFKGGAMASFPGLPQAINIVIEGIARLVEGGYTLAQAIDEYVTANKIKDKEQFQNDLFDVFSKQDKQEESYSKIQKLAESSGSTDVTNDMVAKNLIKEYTDAHVGLHDTKDVLDVVHEKLKEILPDLEKDRLREAYLKQGEFKQPTKKELESGFKQSQRNFERLTSLEKDIKDLTDKGDLFKKNSKKPSPYEKEIEAKQKEKKAIMDSMGIKTSGEDKYKKASYDQRAKAHNDRLEAIGKDIQDKIDKGGLSDKSQKALIKLKNLLSESGVKLDPNSAISQEKTLEGGLSLLKSIKSEFQRTSTEDITKLGDINRGLQKVIDKFSSDKDESEQDVKLQRAKEKAKMDADTFFNKMNRGEFEDKPIVLLSKTDAELIKLEKERGALEQLYRNRRRDYEKQSKTPYRRIAEFARSAMVDWMIGAPSTLAKVAGSAIARPGLETVTKLTFGKAFELIPTETTKAIVERAKAGGESSSWQSIQKGNELYFRQYSKEQLEALYTKSNDAYEKASKEYIDQQAEVNRLKYAEGKQSTEYDEAVKKLDNLKNKRDDALIGAIGNSVYQFVAGSSVKEAMEVFFHRSTSMERNFGDFDKEAWQSTKGKHGKDKLLTNLDNAQYVMNFVGRSHGALKNFSARFSFGMGFIARLEAAVNDGVDISKPDKILELAHESYLDFERGKYQESNWVTDTWNKATNAVERASPELAYLMKADVAITRVPVNMLREGIMEYTLGAFRGSVMAAREYYKAKGIVLQDGYTPENEAQFKTELREQLQKMDPDKAATIIRSFRKGGFGMGLYALALLGHAAFGGWAHKGQTAEDKKKMQRELETGVPELKTGEIEIGNWKMPEFASKIVEHTPSFAPLGFGLGLAKVYENNIIDGRATPTAATNSAMAQIEHIVNSIPQAELVTFLGGKIADRMKPSGQWDDVDQDGNPMKRKAFEITDYFKYLHVPYSEGFKKDILSENYYKQAVASQKGYRQQITEVETNTSLSSKEKEEQRQDLLKQLDEAIDDIYKQNKENPQ